MKYSGIFLVSTDIANKMQSLCLENGQSNKLRGTEFDEEFVFSNGMRMAIQVCLAGDEPCWTQGVLFSANGEEIGCTEVSDTFLQTYTVLVEDDEYEVIVSI